MPRVPVAADLGLGSGPAKIVPLQGKLTVQADARDFGSAQAEQIGKAGEAIGKGGAKLLKAVQAVDERDARISATKDSLLDQDRWLSTVQARKEAAEPGAPAFTENLLKEFDEDSGKVLEGVKPGLYRDLRQQNLQRLRVSLHEEAIGFEATARQAKRKTELEETIHLGAQTIYKAPETFAPTLRTQLDLVESSSMPPAAKAETARQLTHAFAEAHWRGLTDRDPRGTLKLFQSGQAIPGLEYGDFLSLRERAQSAVDRLDARDRVERNEAERALGERVRFAGDMLGKGLTPDGLDTLRREVAPFPELAEGLAAAERVASHGRRFALLPPDQRAAEIERLRTTPQTPETFDALTGAAKILEADDRAAREGRLLQRAEEIGLVDVTDLDLTDTDSVAARVRVSRMAGSHYGTTVDLLTPEERADTIEQLNGMTGEQKAQWLGQVQAATGEAFPDLVRELTTGTGGLDRQTRYLALVTGRPEAAGMAGVVSEAIAAKPEELKLGLVQQNATASQLEADVTAELRDFLTTTGATYKLGGPGAAAMQADIVDMVSRTAQVLMLRGYSYSEAIDKAATALVNSRYEFRDTYRVPLPDGDRDAYLARLDRATADTMAALSPALLDPPGSMRDVPEETRRQVYFEHVRDRGEWTTLPDESGLLLVDEAGNAVTVRGRPVIVKFGGVSGAPAVSDALTAPLQVPGQATAAQPGREPIHAAVMAEESGGRNIVAKDDSRAPEDRATGPMQVMPDTARQMLREMNREDLASLDNAGLQKALLAEPELATQLGRRYLDQQLDRYGDPMLAAAAYHGGPDNVDRWLAEYGDPRTGEVSRAFWLRKVKEAGNPKTAGYVERVLRRLG